MTSRELPAHDRPPALAAVLHRLNISVALLAVALAGVSILLIGIVALRYYMLDNLALSSRSIAYSVEAAVVFNDRDAAVEALTQMSANHPISSAFVLDRDGEELARWAEVPNGVFSRIENDLANLLLPAPFITPIKHDGQFVGTIKVYGSGRDLLRFLMICLACGLACFVLCGMVVSRLSHRASLRIVEPLQRLASVAAKARRERQFDQRVSLPGIAELQELGDDFNSLLAELERWQAQVASNTESLTYQANHDALTGLANRAYFEARLAVEIGQAAARGGSLALFFIDADRFKSINDELGHDVGDAVLCAIALRLRSKVREGDLVARLGGDEFAVLLAPLNDTSQAGRIAGNMLDSMAEPIELPSGNTLTSSLSIGIALFPNHAIDADGLLKMADEAMYQSKRAGRGAYSLASERNSGFRGDKT